MFAFRQVLLLNIVWRQQAALLLRPAYAMLTKEPAQWRELRHNSQILPKPPHQSKPFDKGVERNPRGM